MGSGPVSNWRKFNIEGYSSTGTIEPGVLSRVLPHDCSMADLGERKEKINKCIRAHPGKHQSALEKTKPISRGK
jgi:hypothetical protein